VDQHAFAVDVADLEMNVSFRQGCVGVSRTRL
jgi:hypothetical protein